MPDSTRRGFMKVAGVGVAAAGVAAAVPSMLGGTSAVASEVALPKNADGSMVAYIHDVKSGQLSVMIEGHEVTVTDHQLVARLAQVLHPTSSTSV